MNLPEWRKRMKRLINVEQPKPKHLNILEFRVLVRPLFSPDLHGDWVAKLLSYDYVKATPEQQAACVAEVRKDIAAETAGEEDVL